MANRLLHANDRDGAHPDSWYAATAVGVPRLPSLVGGGECDVAIIGGGFTGLSAALHLASKGYDVALIEAHRVAWGASGRNGGQVGTGQRIPQDELEARLDATLARRAWDVAEDAKALVAELIRRHDIPCDYRPGSLHVNHRRRFDERSRRYAELLNTRYGYDAIRYVPPRELREMLGARGCSGATLDVGAGHLHPLNYGLGLARAARAAGARLYERSEALEIGDGEPLRVRTATGELRARYLVYACNGYLDGLEPEVARRVMPINNYIVATEPLPEALATSLIRDGACVSDSRFVVNYYRLSADRRMLFGGGESYGYRFPADVGAFVRRHMTRVFPQLRGTRIDYAWGGTLAITRSRLPCFRRIRGNVVSASGYSGSGVALATCAGAIVAEAIDGVATRFDVMSALPTPPFPGPPAMRAPLLALAMTWYALRDRL